MIQPSVNLKSSQVRSWPSDHFRPSRRVHVTVIASPPSPGALTPPLSRVGIVVAWLGAYLKSFVELTRVSNVAVLTFASVTWLK